MKNVLILGVCGFIGSFLRKRLQPHYNIIGYDRIDPSQVPPGENFRYIYGDFTKDYFSELLQENNIDTVFHLICSTVPSQDTSIIEDEIYQNVLPTVRLLNDMANTGVERIIFASSGGTVYGQSNGTPHKTSDKLSPICSYGVQKSMIESYMSLFNTYHGMRCISARMANPYGLWTEKSRLQGIIPLFISNLYSKNAITLFGDTSRDYIHINDVTEVLYKLIDYSGDKTIFNIGTGKSHYLSEIVSIIEEKSNMKFESIKHEGIRLCDVTENILDISETVSELDWMPSYDIHAGIDDILSQFVSMRERQP